jgi:hypothetical protein
VLNLPKSGDTGDGPDRLEKSGDRPERLRGPITDFKTGSKERLVDRPAEAGGDPSKKDPDRSAEAGGDPNKKGLDQSAEAGGDRSDDPKGQGLETPAVGLITVETTFESSTPAINTSEASSKEVSELLRTSTEVSDKQKEDDPVPPKSELPIANPKEKVEESPSTPSPKRNLTTTKNDQSDREKMSPRTFLKEKESKTDTGKEKGTIDPPDWRDYEKRDYVHTRKFAGIGAWSEREMRSIALRSRKYDGLIIMPQDQDPSDLEDKLKAAASEIKVPNPEGWEEYKREVVAHRERMRNEQVIRLNAIARNDGNDSGSGHESRSRARGSKDHLTVIDKLSAINSGGHIEKTSDRPMSDVRVEYTRDPSLPNVLSGTTGMRLLEEKSQNKVAPSISHRADNRGEGYSQGRTHSPGYEKEPGRSPRKLKIVPPLNKNERSFYDQEGSGSGGDNESDGYYRRRPNRHSDPEDPRDPGGSGGSRDPRRSGGPSGPGGPGDPGYPGGSGGRGYRRRRRDDEDSDGWDRNVKMKHPTPYNGKPDIQVYDHWMASITNYAQTMKIRERTMIGMMSAYVTGKAGDFYMNRIAGRADEWTYQTVFQAIFDHCFPKHIIRQFREQWNRLTQGKREVREYTEEIEKLARRFNEMTERTVVLKFWDGLDPELRETVSG